METMERTAEHCGTVRGEFRYFALWDTPEGVIETTCIRKADREGASDVSYQAELFAPAVVNAHYGWLFVAALLRGEMEMPEPPKHGDPGEDVLAAMRRDSEKLRDRALRIIRGTPADYLLRS